MNALFMATAMALAPAPAAPVHQVLPGESLSTIARCELGAAERWVELLELNRQQITDPDIIEPGWTLVLPEGASGECPTEPVVRAVSAPRASASRAEAAPTRRRASAPRAKASSKATSSSGSGLAKIRACESGGNYGAVSANGKHRGAYQFDQQTWQSVGGTGDPAAASPAEQDRRASALQQQRGSSPWPSCS